MTRPTVDRAQWSVVESAIRRVPHYAACRTIRQGELPIHLLKPICMFARTYRLERAADLLVAYQAASLPLYVGAILSHANGRDLLVPPIVEVHGSNHVLIDGLHRIMLARRSGVSEVSAAIVSGDLAPLPGAPLTWDCIETISHHTTRDVKFRGFKPEYFRPIAELIDSPNDTDEGQCMPRSKQESDPPNNGMESDE